MSEAEGGMPDGRNICRLYSLLRSAMPERHDVYRKGDLSEGGGDLTGRNVKNEQKRLVLSERRAVR